MNDLRTFELASPDAGTEYTHRIFPYPAKFPTHIAAGAIERFSQPGDKVLDPFCGSGTVLVEAVLRNRSAIGIELNPVAAKVSSAKARLYSARAIASAKGMVRQLADIQRHGVSKWVQKHFDSSLLPQYEALNKWFVPSMQRELASIKGTFIIPNEANAEMSDLLWLAFLKIILPCSNQESDTRYVAVIKPVLTSGYALARFGDALREIISAVEPCSISRVPSSATVEEGDSLSVLQSKTWRDIDLVVTSPPYLNTYDYYLYHKHRIYWMNRSPQIVRRQELGCHHIVDSQSAEEAIGVYETYLNKFLMAVSTTMRAGGHLNILIGDGIVKGTVFRAGDSICQIAARNGFDTVEVDTHAAAKISRGFIKDSRLTAKQHHNIIFRKSNA